MKTKKNDSICIKNFYVFTWIAIFFLTSALLLSQYIGYIFGFSLIGIIAIVLYLPIKKYFKKNKLSFTKIKIIICLLSSVGISVTIWQFVTLYIFDSNIFISILFILSFTLLLIPILIIFYSIFDLLYVNSGLNVKHKAFYFIPMISAFLFFFIVQPLNIFINNTEDIPISLKDTFLSELFFFFILLSFLYIMLLMPFPLVRIIGTFFSATFISSYIQLMFFNKYTGVLLGGNYDWKSNQLYSILNIFVWLFVFILVFFLSFNKKTTKIPFFLNIAILIMLFSGLFSLLISSLVSGKDLNNKDNRNYYLSTDEKYTVGKENVIILIADAVDNAFIKEILNDNPDFFNDYNDFTLYTDTCCVYDYTGRSLQQMLYGYTFKDGTERTVPFMERLKNNGYRILSFSYNSISGPDNPSQYIDNYVYSEKAVLIRKDRIRDNYWKVTSYQLFPCMFKHLSKVDKVNFDNCLDINFVTRNNVTENEVFDKNLNLSMNPISDKCFIYQHIDGAHYPSDDYVKDTMYSLTIFKKYIAQMKELGVYDDSVIIIAADHGVHDDVDGVPFPTAGTPMFMIKGKNEKHTEIVLSKTPMYFMDFQPTIIKYAGLY